VSRRPACSTVSIRSTTVGVERSPVGVRLVVTRRIDAPPAAVWALLTDTRRWPEWGPSITDIDSSDREIAAGTRGTVRLRGGLRLPFEVDSCTENRWDWRVCGIRATGHRVEPAPADARNRPAGEAERSEGSEATAKGAGPERCRAVFEVPLFAAPYAVICVRALSHLDRLASECDDRAAGDTTSREN
jgi:hypothetical protein